MMINQHVDDAPGDLLIKLRKVFLSGLVELNQPSQGGAPLRPSCRIDCGRQGVRSGVALSGIKIIDGLSCTFREGS